MLVFCHINAILLFKKNTVMRGKNMSLQFVLGSSGHGKSQYIYSRIINESIENQNTNYILLVPEQYSLSLQKKMVMLHPSGGTMNIDVIGFNRLAYRVFDELNIKPAKILEDFGKTMLIRQVAGTVKNQLTIYANNLDKPGFIDEAKSLMSEMYQYDLTGDSLKKVLEQMENTDDRILYNKLKDINTIFHAFEKRVRDNYIVAEQLIELLVENIHRSELIKNSVIVMDGFTGFTPIQLNLIRELLKHSKKIYSVLTIDWNFYNKKEVAEHELFYLTRKTIDKLSNIAMEEKINIDDDIFVDGISGNRWTTAKNTNSELLHLEKSIFRYPYKKYNQDIKNIFVTAYDNPRGELMGIAENIRRLVVEEKYRYKDIAIICGNLESITGTVSQVMPVHNIPYFLDYSRPVKNNPYIDAIGHLLKIVENDFSYDSIFAFLKSGIIEDLEYDEIEELENYVLARGIKGLYMWESIWEDTVEDTRKYVIDIVMPFYEKVNKKNACIQDCVDAIREFMNLHSYQEKMADIIGIYDKVQELLEKMQEIMGSENVEIGEFAQLVDIGLKELSLGMIPGTVDMVTIGDITRTRLEEVKVLFIMGVNDGIIPARSVPAQIINDREKEQLSKMGFELAPTEKLNSYVEQFYLYNNMTKPSDKLYLSYTNTSSSNEPMRPSYIIGRLNNIFPKLKVNSSKELVSFVSTKDYAVERLITLIHTFFEGDDSRLDETLRLYKVLSDNGNYEILENVFRALAYSNVPKNLSKAVSELVRLKLTSQSVSRLEQYAKCAYGYFLKYILGLKERNIGILDSRNIGNILHSAMERLYRHVYDNLNNDWNSVTDLVRDKLVEDFVERSLEEEYYYPGMDAGRYNYLKSMLIRIGKRTAKMLYHISNKDVFTPSYFEYKFQEKIPVSEKSTDSYYMSLSGIIDRADINFISGSNSLELRIVDYKSGNYEFKIGQLYEGLQLQLSIYMNIMLEMVDKQYKDMEVLPAGMYYYQMKDPYIEADNPQSADEKRDKDFKLKGLDASDRAVFNNITQFAMLKAKDIVNEVNKGNISKEPIANGQNKACDYCPYATVCRFDKKVGGNKYRYPKYKDKDFDKVYPKILERLEEESNAVDKGAKESN